MKHVYTWLFIYIPFFLSLQLKSQPDPLLVSLIGKSIANHRIPIPLSSEKDPNLGELHSPDFQKGELVVYNGRYALVRDLPFNNMVEIIVNLRDGTVTRWLPKDSVARLYPSFILKRPTLMEQLSNE